MEPAALVIFVVVNFALFMSVTSEPFIEAQDASMEKGPAQTNMKRYHSGCYVVSSHKAMARSSENTNKIVDSSTTLSIIPQSIRDQRFRNFFLNFVIGSCESKFRNIDDRN